MRLATKQALRAEEMAEARKGPGRRRTRGCLMEVRGTGVGRIGEEEWSAIEEEERGATERERERSER